MVTILNLKWEYIGVASFNENPQISPFVFQMFYDQMTSSPTSSPMEVNQVVELPSTNTEDIEMTQISPEMPVSSGFCSD